MVVQGAVLVVELLDFFEGVGGVRGGGRRCLMELFRIVEMANYLRNCGWV